MKKLFLSFIAMSLIALGAVNASAVSSTYAPATVAQDDKVKLKNEELPETVKTTLKGDAYKDWTISAAYHVKSSNQFEIELKKDNETKTIKLDKDGNLITE